MTANTTDPAAARYAETLRHFNELTDFARTLPVAPRGGYPSQFDHLYDATLTTLLHLLHRCDPADVAAATAEARGFMERQAARRAAAGRVAS